MLPKISMCFITNSSDEVLFKSFTVSNKHDGFETLFQRIQSVSDDLTKVKVGLETTGHSSYNLLGFLLDKVKEHAALKSSIYRLVCILFLELEKLVSTLHMVSVYALLAKFPSASAVANTHLTKLTNLLSKSSKCGYGKDTAIMFREAARSSIYSNMSAKFLKLRHTIKLIQVSHRMSAMIIAEIGDFSHF